MLQIDSSQLVDKKRIERDHQILIVCLTNKHVIKIFKAKTSDAKIKN